MKASRLVAMFLIVVMVTMLMTGCSGNSKPTNNATSADNFKPIELKFSTSFGTTHKAYAVLEAWCKKVAEATGGKVTATLYPGESLLKGPDMYEGLLNGVVDVIETDPAYSMSYFPLASAFFLGGIQFSNSKAATYAANEYFTKSDFEELKKAKLLFAYGMSPFCVISTKPIRTLEDFKGKQVRATGFALKTVEALGGTPVGISIAETYEALLKGTVDAAINPYEALEGWKFGEVAKYVSWAPVIVTAAHYVAMNLDVWNSLPMDIQKAIEKVNSECVDMIAPLWDEIDASGYQFGLKNGVEYYTVPDNELKRWIEVIKPLETNWVKERTDMGLPAQKALDSLKALAAKYNKIYGNP